MDHDLDDTHLCIKCSQTIVGLENYIQHRKRNCSNSTTSSHNPTKLNPTNTTPTQQLQQGAEVTPAITYEPFNFNEPEPSTSAGHGGKTSKSLGESYDLPYELGADVFFSSLQLQSVQSVVGQHVHPTSGGKTVSSMQSNQMQRQKSLQQDSEHSTNVEETWIATHATSTEPHHDSGDHLLKAINEMGEIKKTYEPIFKPITYEHESPEVSEDEEEDEVDVDIDDDDDEDFYPMVVNATGGKWKLPLLRQSPPVVPISHTGGKWKPEHRPNLRVAHTQISRLSPNWDDHIDDMDGQEGQHPPSDHTQGKWIPGTKLQRLEYKEVVELAKCNKSTQDYWCNICCRKLKSKLIYENHLKTSYHLKRAEPEQQLEKAVIKEIPREDINKSFSLNEFKPLSVTVTNCNSKKRKRRSTFLKCSLCKHVMARHLIGKHLISHYHYRRMQLHPSLSLHMVLDNIHAIVLQSPFQCRPCRFYANTEETFLLHWNSAGHLDVSEGPGRFWCSYCQFECEDNNQMRRHLLGPEHKEVLLAINRSVPICISKRLSIDCTKCGVGFRYNFELRRHILNYHSGVEFMGSASDSYQSKFRCLMCPDVLSSQIALQRHEKFKHCISKYFCSICALEFNSPCKARRHRKTLDHKQKALAATQKLKTTKDETNELLKPEEEIKCPLIHNESLEHLEVSHSELNASIILDELPCTSKEAKLSITQPKTSPASISLKCKYCQENFSSRVRFKKHREKEHLETQHKCMSCAQTFITAQELGRHARACKPTTIKVTESHPMTKQISGETNEQGQKVWKCDLCEFRAPFESDILYHRVLHFYGCVGKNQLIKCLLCEKSFRKHSLRFHLRQHTNEKTFKCQICNNTFSRPYNLKDHIKKVHGKTTEQNAEGAVRLTKKVEKTFPCEMCSKVFKSKYSMKMHSLAHQVATADERQRFTCTQENCDYGAVSKYLLQIHFKSHAKESLKCTEKDCRYVGKSDYHMKRHLQSHMPAIESKLFPCDKCSFTTKTKGHLQRHLRQHTGDKPYSCPHCDFRSTSWESIRKHVLQTDRHPGKFVYECKLCEKEEEINKTIGAQKEDKEKLYKTNSYQEYQQHLKKKHKVEKGE